MTRIVIAQSESDFDGVRGLVKAFMDWHGVRNREQIDQVHLYYERSGLAQEMATLPGNYAPPKGCLLLATEDGEQAGCVGLIDTGDGVCEMKRMFVRTEFQGRGVGGALARAIIEKAKEIGYRKMRLDTGAKQVEAIGLYRSLGFQDIEPFYELSEELQGALVFLGLNLSPNLD